MTAQTPVPGCREHPGMGFVYVCKTCNNDLICMDCVVGRHQKHNLSKLAEFLSEQTQKIQQYEKKLSKYDIPKTESAINEEHFKENGKEFRQMIDDIKIQGEEMKREIDKITNRLVNLCRDLVKMNADVKEKNKELLTTYLREELEPQLDRCQRISGTDDDIIAKAWEILSTGPTTPLALTSLRVAVFQPGNISNAVLGRMLGSLLVEGENTSFRAVPPCAVISSFKTSFDYDECRTCRSSDEAWLSYWDEEQIYRVDQKGNVRKKIECNAKVHSIAVSPTTGGVWFCVKEDKSIRDITSDGNIVTRFNVGSNPLSLCITQEDMVVVGMTDDIKLYIAHGWRVTNASGHVCTQEAVVPHHMAYSITSGDVAVTDSDYESFGNYLAGKESGKQPSVIVMDKHLKLKFQCRYIGGMESQAGDSQQFKFYPWDVCFDGAGDVLVSEKVSKSVMLIDGSNGHFLRTVYVPDAGIPRCIYLQDSSALMIAHENEIKIIKYRK
ncbi:uncharacterized protein [Argopecten irradians]|uniref:uncharacterized protein n=1 Tax=Argopecten irradians TaxID=31199 RepID=UPI003712860C